MENKWTWLKEYMQENNISQKDVADALQWQKPRVSELLCGKRDFPGNKVFPAAHFFNLDLEEFIKYNSGFTKEVPLTNGKSPSKTPTDMITINFVTPLTNGDKIFFQDIGIQTINSEILQKFIPNPTSNILALFAQGDAMQPSIDNGDLVWFDSSVKSPLSDGLYLFTIKGELFIKRLQLDKFHHTATLISDNSLYPPIIINAPEKLKTLGKVVAVTKGYY